MLILKPNTKMLQLCQLKKGEKASSSGAKSGSKGGSRGGSGRH